MLWVPNDQERFDYSALVCSGSDLRVRELLSELERIDDWVVKQLEASLTETRKRDTVEHYRDNLKHLGPYSAIPIVSTLVSGLIPSYAPSQVISPIQDSLPWVFGLALAFLVIYSALGIYYIGRIFITEFGV